MLGRGAIIVCWDLGFSPLPRCMRYKRSMRRHSTEPSGDVLRDPLSSAQSAVFAMESMGAVANMRRDIATASEVQQLSDIDLIGIVENGISGAGMPAFGSLGQKKVKAIVNYLRVLQGRGTGTTVKLPGDPQAGESLFLWKGTMFNLPYGERPRRLYCQRSVVVWIARDGSQNSRYYYRSSKKSSGSIEEHHGDHS